MKTLVFVQPGSLGWIPCLIPLMWPKKKRRKEKKWDHVMLVYMDWWRIIFLFKSSGNLEFNCLHFRPVLFELVLLKAFICQFKWSQDSYPEAWQCCWMFRSRALVYSVTISMCVRVWSPKCWMCFPVAYLCCRLLQIWQRSGCHENLLWKHSPPPSLNSLR